MGESVIPLSPNHAAELEAWFATAASKAKSECKVCGGDGYVWPKEGGQSQRCECLENINRILRYKRGNLPRHHWVPQSFINNGQVFDYIERLPAPRSLALLGSNGTGKTTHACFVLKSAADKGIPIFRIEASEVERAISLMKSGRGWVDQWLQDSMFAKLVCVDEMGVECVRGVCGREARSMLNYFVKHRAEQDLPTIICTNLSEQDFTEHYGESIASVVFGRFTKVAMISRDMRGQ
jgi:hypothetical protein